MGVTSRKRYSNDLERLESHLAALMQKGREIQKMDRSLPAPPPSYEKGGWTALKLILVRYYMPGYLNIQAKRMNVAYVDLFAGPGLNLIGNRKRPLPGSPLLPFTLTQKENAREFSFHVYCDTQEEYVSALETRLAMLGQESRCSVNRRDANIFVDRLASLLDGEGIKHSLVFIDPEGLDFKFDSLARLLDTIDCDAILNFPSAGLHRNLNNPSGKTEVTIREFLGLKSADPIPRSGDEALETYKTNLGELGKNVSMDIKVSSGDGPFHYHLIPAVKETPGGSPWFYRIFQGAKKMVEGFEGKILDVIADQIDGELTKLEDFPR
jgi:three-Cys-motif partner protein